MDKQVPEPPGHTLLTIRGEPNATVMEQEAHGRGDGTVSGCPAAACSASAG